MNSQFTDGYRGRIGLVATAPGNSTEADFNRYRPEGVAVMTTRTPLKSSTPEGIAEMNGYTEAAVRMLAENCFCDVILMSSTAGSFLDGRAADEERAQRLSRETRTTVITSAGCMLKALDALAVHNITLITPSSADLNRVECAFLEDSGYRIKAQGGFLLSSPKDILCISPEEIKSKILQTDTSDSEAVVISCSGLHVMEILESMEQILGKPVIASNQFGLWGSLRTAGIMDKISALGQLMLL